MSAPSSSRYQQVKIIITWCTVRPSAITKAITSIVRMGGIVGFFLGCREEHVEESVDDDILLACIGKCKTKLVKLKLAECVNVNIEGRGLNPFWGSSVLKQQIDLSLFGKHEKTSYRYRLQSRW